MGEIPKNPYRPGAATAPRFLAGRDEQISRFAKMLQAAPEIPANLRLTGLRGVGKSVLLKQLEEVAKTAHWSVVRVQLEPRHNTERELSALVVSLAENATRRMSTARAIRGKMSDAVLASRQIFTAKFEDITFGMAGASDTETELARVLFDVTEAAGKTGHQGFAILLDEAQVVRDDKDREGQHPLSMLVASVNVLQEAGLPIALVLCGLPTLRANLQKARTYSERMFKGENIGELPAGPARDAFIIPLEGTHVTADEELVARVLDEVEGFPFFIQLWGAELWDAASDAGISTFTVAMLDEIESHIYQRLDEDFYAGRVDALTAAEQDILMLGADCPYPPLKTADIRARSARKQGNINVLMGRVAEQGVLYRVQNGQYEYTAPKFHAYLKRRAAAISAREAARVLEPVPE